MTTARRSPRIHYRPLEYWRNEPKPSTVLDEQKWLIRVKDDGGRSRTLCCHPYNAALVQYGKYQANHKSECSCPLHRKDTYWRRLSSHLLFIRNNAFKNKKCEDIQRITGLTLQNYLHLLRLKFCDMYSGIISERELQLSSEELSMCKFYTIDEWFPRCAGKCTVEKGQWSQAEFFAKVFSAENTRYLIEKKAHAESLGVCVDTHKDLINGKKVGKILPEAELSFLNIIPSQKAIEYWYERISKFS
jgi:hypothetical protein